MTVQNNATLGGNGSISGNVTVQGGGTISPGDATVNGGIGALTLSSTAFNNTAILVIDLNATTSDVLHVNGTLDLGALNSDILNFSQLATATAPSYTLATYTGVIGIFDTVNNVPNGYQLVYGATELDLVNVTAAPEPATWVGASLALVSLVASAKVSRDRRGT